MAAHGTTSSEGLCSIQRLTEFGLRLGWEFTVVGKLTRDTAAAQPPDSLGTDMESMLQWHLASLEASNCQPAPVLPVVPEYDL